MKPAFEYEANMIVHCSLINSWRAFIKKPLVLREISYIDLPSLFIYAENDICPSWSVKQVSNHIPNSRYIKIEGAEHFIWLNNKKELGNVLKPFIKLTGEGC